MTWMVMRRDLDRDVRVAECASEAEAGARLLETRSAYPNEEAWVEPNPLLGAPVPPLVEHFEGAGPQWSGEIPVARIVSEHGSPRIDRVPSTLQTRRAVPWQAAVVLLDATVVGLICVLGALHYILITASLVPSTDHQPVLVSGAQLIVVSVVSCAGAIELFLFRLRSAQRFLERALVIEGVVTGAGIEISVGGAHRLVAREMQLGAEGSRVHLFWLGRKVIQLARIGAASGPDGEVTWDASTPGIPLRTRVLAVVAMVLPLIAISVAVTR